LLKTQTLMFSNVRQQAPPADTPPTSRRFSNDGIIRGY
jgi:hypothetical protein